jgi:two-component system sensor histidine kinase KdpD
VPQAVHLYLKSPSLSNFLLHKYNKKNQYLVSILLILSVAGICYVLSDFIEYKVVAFLLLLIVSLIAMFFDIAPVLLAACLSAVVWNYFFIPPRFTFAIQSTENILLFSMYFIIAMVNAVLTYKIREIEKDANKRTVKEDTLKLYDTILNSLSHELRTPIATIIGATDTLQEGKHKLSEKNAEDLLSEISKASLRLNRQVGNLLNMSRLESGFFQPKKDWCDINELIYDVLNQLKDILPYKPVEVNIKETIPLFKLDQGLLEQVLHNLIHNAAVYTPKYAVITISASLGKDNHLVLTVEDNGNGFPENEIEHVFEKFYRLKNTHAGGTGLGLSIVKGFVESMGGTIRLENGEDYGAKFTIDLPAEIAHVNDIRHE